MKLLLFLSLVCVSLCHKTLDDYEYEEFKAMIEPSSDWYKTCTGWGVLELCSTIFGSRIPEEIAMDIDIGYIGMAAEYDIDYDDQSVSGRCRLNGEPGTVDNSTYKAIFRPEIGCTLVENLSEEEIRAQNLGDHSFTPLDPNVAWPDGEGFFEENIPEELDMECIERVAEEQFQNTLTNTRAIVVIYKENLVFERYSSYLTKDNPLLGWSATKSITGALIGVVVGEGNLNIYDPAPVPEWYVDPNDPRQNITTDMMLRMSSGTRWIGDIGPTTECLYYSNGNCAHTSALQPLVEEPDTVFNYNSGSTYILSRIALDNRRERIMPSFEWIKKKLFYPIGAHSAYIEFQPNQVYLGGAMGYATPRDWARFGLLYLRDGVWNGNRILPEGWVQYSSTPSHTNEDYAGHFWREPDVDDKLFFASGFRNQNTFIFPNQNAIVVRMAMPRPAAHPVFNRKAFLNGIKACFPENDKEN